LENIFCLAVDRRPWALTNVNSQGYRR